MATQKQQPIPFSILGFSGEDPDFPITELSLMGQNTKGWHSKRFCFFPQEIIVRLSAPIRLREIQFLSHQYKISSRIDLYYFFAPESQTQFSQNLKDIEWEKLGYLTLDSNEQSNFQSRELKSVYLSTTVSCVRIVIHKPFPNKYNIFNQVSLVGLSFFGDFLGREPITSDYFEKEEEIDEALAFDKSALEKLRELEGRKREAISMEDFMLAKKLKEQIDFVRFLGNQIRIVRQEQAYALKKEDYETANSLKMEVIGLQTKLATVGFESSSPVSNQLFSEDRSHYEPKRSPDQFEREFEPGQIYREEEEPTVGLSDEKAKSRSLWNRVSHDDQVIPAARNAFESERAIKEGGPSEGPGKEAPEEKQFGALPPEPEPLSLEKQKYGHLFIPFVGEDICLHSFSKVWSLRETGMNKLLEEIKNWSSSNVLQTSDPPGLFEAILGLLSFTIADKVAQVSLKAMHVLKEVIPKDPGINLEGYKSMVTWVNSIIHSLMEKFGDRGRDTAMDLCIELANTKCVGTPLLVDQLVESQHKLAPKVLTGRLAVLTRLVQKYETGVNVVQLFPVIEFAKEGFEHSNKDVREASHNLLIELMKKVGEAKIIPLLNGLRQGHIDALMEDLAKITGKPIEKQAFQAETNDGVRKAGLANKTQPLKACDFCSKVDKSFSDSGKLDMHLWKECPMLTLCKECALAIEVSELNDHLLSSCDKKALYTQCDRCQESVPKAEMETHKLEMACVEAKPINKANRCPLCHEDIMPGDQGWKAHLVIDGCPNNDRTS